MSKFLVRVISLSVLALLSIAALYYYDITGYQKIKYPFERIFSNTIQPKAKNSFEFKPYHFTRIIGIQKNICYLLLDKRSGVFALDMEQKQLQKVISTGDVIINGMLVNSAIYLLHRGRFEMLGIEKDSLRLLEEKTVHILPNKSLFTDSVNMIGRIPVDSSFLKFKFGILNSRGEVKKMESGISEDIEDGGLSTDGFLCSSNGRVFFVYHYGDRISCFDTSLNLKYHAKTIDKFNISLPGVFRDSITKSFSFNGPRRINHLVGFANDKFLFINSVIKSTTELSSVFRNSFTADMYDAGTGQYKQSFYIHDIDINKVRDARLVDNKLYLLLDTKLVVYECPGIF
jgi:hypothetical protein